MLGLKAAVKMSRKPASFVSFVARPERFLLQELNVGNRVRGEVLKMKSALNCNRLLVPRKLSDAADAPAQ